MTCGSFLGQVFQMDFYLPSMATITQTYYNYIVIMAEPLLQLSTFVPSLDMIDHAYGKRNNN